MADTPFISQEVLEAGAEDSGLAVSQTVLEGGANNATPFISQAVLEAAANNASPFISQVVIEYSTGPAPSPTGGTTTVRFDAGLGPVDYYIVPPLTDSGDSLRDKVLKDVHVVGKITDANVQYYAYGPGDEINVADIEDGINSSSGMKFLPNAARVVRSARVPINVPNAMLHTIRVAGRWSGGTKDRIDQIGAEVAMQGVRR